ncbi:response regulator [Aquisediminimonas sediminicola]|uniref:response regulator n=1 Tax=Alteraquisediminimonas sediminicola TaxID=2676787 RepID=UPI001C8D665A|nr:response regulator [Aquisediminimonas sediminicola]
MTLARLLVVEDEAELRADLIELLECCDFEVSGSGDGTEAFAMIQRDRPDLVICDVQLPGMTGIEILKGLRASKGYRPIMLMFTAYGDDEMIQSLHKLGAQGALVKPVGFKVMLNKIMELLAHRPAMEVAAAMGAPAVLIVEQEIELAEEIAELLESHGRTAHHIDNLADAFEHLRANPDIGGVLLDIRLGGDNALHLIHAVATDPALSLRNIQFGLMGNEHAQTIRAEKLPVVRTAFLQKPIRPKDLLAFANSLGT